MENRRCGVPGRPIVKLKIVNVIRTGLETNDVPLVTTTASTPGGGGGGGGGGGCVPPGCWVSVVVKLSDPPSLQAPVNIARAASSGTIINESGIFSVIFPVPSIRMSNLSVDLRFRFTQGRENESVMFHAG